MITKLLHGEPTVAHLAAPSAVVAGEVVNIGDTPVIAVNRCANGEVGAFAVGGGVYEAVAQTSTGAPVAGSRANFATNIKIATADGKDFGVCLAVSAAVCIVRHDPAGTEVST
jgi:predicted RecA/RadA family phage recombinase